MSDVNNGGKLLAYGKILADKIRAIADYTELTNFEKFVLDRGYEFDTEDALQAGYSRLSKCHQDILITQDEFIVEAGKYFATEILKEVYNALVLLLIKRSFAPVRSMRMRGTNGVCAIRKQSLPIRKDAISGRSITVTQK